MAIFFCKKQFRKNKIRKKNKNTNYTPLLIPLSIYFKDKNKFAKIKISLILRLPLFRMPRHMAKKYVYFCLPCLHFPYPYMTHTRRKNNFFGQLKRHLGFEMPLIILFIFSSLHQALPVSSLPRTDLQ